MEIIGYLLAGLVGITLGLIGGGGSILTVPILVYIFALVPAHATAYSLFIVGSTSLVGAINNYRKDNVSISTALFFGLTSISVVFVTRKFIIPTIPQQLFNLFGWQISQALLIMILFAVLMLFASVSMIKNRTIEIVSTDKNESNKFKLLQYGVLIGLVTGFLGAGGGFLLLPVLVLVFNLPMKKAVGTSLLIIALNSLIGFTGDLGHFEIDWQFLLTITSISIIGIFVGGFLSTKIDGNKLKKSFGWFVLSMGIYIILKELLPILFHS
jgi:uncharacterized membrane protein YfcA